MSNSTVAPAGMPGPNTGMPPNKFVVLVTVTIGLPVVVLPAARRRPTAFKVNAAALPVAAELNTIVPLTGMEITVAPTGIVGPPTTIPGARPVVVKPVTVVVPLVTPTAPKETMALPPPTVMPPVL